MSVSQAADNGVRVMHERALRSEKLLVGISQDLDITTRISLLPDGVMPLVFNPLTDVRWPYRTSCTVSLLNTTLFIHNSTPLSTFQHSTICGRVPVVEWDLIKHVPAFK